MRADTALDESVDLSEFLDGRRASRPARGGMMKKEDPCPECGDTSGCRHISWVQRQKLDPQFREAYEKELLREIHDESERAHAAEEKLKHLEEDREATGRQVANLQERVRELEAKARLLDSIAEHKWNLMAPDDSIPRWVVEPNADEDCTEPGFVAWSEEADTMIAALEQAARRREG